MGDSERLAMMRFFLLHALDSPLKKQQQLGRRVISEFRLRRSPSHQTPENQKGYAEKNKEKECPGNAN
jgi:hypothetical protein